MGLYLVQHGECVPETLDPDRPLTEKGKADVLKVAYFLKGKINVDIIWHSTKLRARETAGLISEAFSPKNGLAEKEGLAPNDSVNKIKEDILKEKPEHLMIVGHLPFLGKLASLLLTDSESANIVIFHPAGVVCLEQTNKVTWAVAWNLIPELINI
ncbi:MAG: phosphohistidine phosphatase SixA [Spirochaetota bacterium]